MLQQPERVPLLIDTDTAADDCFALLIGLLHPVADLRAVTIVGGNVGFDQQVHNALLTIGLAGRLGEVPVHTGARAPLEREWVSAEEVHGDGVGGLRRGEHAAAAAAESAVDALLRHAREQQGRLRIVAIGPLTNLALAVQRDPGFAARIERLVIMGGSINGRGNITPAAEYNIYVDPEAAAVVLDAGFAHIDFVTWDPLTIRDAVFDADRIREIERLDTALADFFVRANQATFAFDTGEGLAGSSHCDSLAVLLALDRSLVTAERPYHVAVETSSALTRGATVFDWRAAVPNARGIEAIDRERFFAAVRAVFAADPPGQVRPLD